jgi:hypothetical protein
VVDVEIEDVESGWEWIEGPDRGYCVDVIFVEFDSVSQLLEW